MKLGRTIAGNRDSAESELARQQLLEKREKKKRVQLLLLGVVVVATVVLGVIIIQSAVKKVPATGQKKTETVKYIPTVSIIDEDGSNYITERTKQYKCNLDRGTAETLEDIVRMIEYLKKQGLKVGYVDVRIEGRAYYKVL